MKKLLCLAIVGLFLFATAPGVYATDPVQDGDGLMAGGPTAWKWKELDVDFLLEGVELPEGPAGATGAQGEVGPTGLTGKGLDDQYKAGLELRLFDEKHTALRVYYNYDFNNEVSEVGMKVEIKLFKSYLDRKIEALEKRLQ